MFDKNKTKGIPLPAAPKTVGIASFNMDSISRLLDSKGIVAFHVKHALNPHRQNLITGEDLTKNKDTYLYYEIRPIRVVPQSMNGETMLMQYSIDTMFQTIMLNVGGYYLDNTKEKERVLVRPNDLFIFNPTITMGAQDLIEVKNERIVRLKHYVYSVDYLVDQDKRVYTMNDFDIENGKLIFREQLTDRILSVVYTHPLIYNVQSIPHYIRILQSNAEGIGGKDRQAVYAPQMMFCKHVTLDNFGEDTYDWFRNDPIINYEKYLSMGKYN